ncbi:MAG: hypothetical protein ACR2L2_19645 [Acidobacteriota bacterium]
MKQHSDSYWAPNQSLDLTLKSVRVALSCSKLCIMRISSTGLLPRRSSRFHSSTFLKTIPVPALLVLLMACASGPIGRDESTPSGTNASERLAAQGTYVHPASRIRFPKNIGGFQRERVIRYDAKGLDVSAAYNCLNALHPMAATVYVYPAPSLVSIGSSPEVVASARARLTENEFEHRKQEILHAHPGGRLVEQRDTVRVETGQSYSGKLAIFEYEGVFAGSRVPIRSHLYLFCYVGGKWTVKYRFTHPKAVDASKETEEFIQSLSWDGAGVPR